MGELSHTIHGELIRTARESLPTPLPREGTQIWASTHSSDSVGPDGPLWQVRLGRRK